MVVRRGTDAHVLTIRCVWPVDCRNSCGSPAHYGHTCGRHLERVRSMVGTLACAWPGCVASLGPQGFVRFPPEGRLPADRTQELTGCLACDFSEGR